MGCGNSSVDPEIKNLAEKINAAIQAKSTLQYQISQLKFLQETKKAYPDIKDVKEAQIQNLKLSKEIKDTENLLSSIKENEMRSEDIRILEETFQKLQQMLKERDEEIKSLEEEVQIELKTIEDYKQSLAKLNQENEDLKADLDLLMQSEKYKTIKSLEEAIEQLEMTLESKNNEYKISSSSPDPSQSKKGQRNSSMSKVHQQLIMEIKRKTELEDTLKEYRSKAEGSDSYLGEELRNDILKLEEEEKELLLLIEEAELKKKQLEKNKIESETRLSPYEQYKEFDALESRFESSISSLMNGVGDIRSEKELINEENRKLRIEVSEYLSNSKKDS